MKKIFAVLMAGVFMLVTVPALANLEDTRETIAQNYGNYRLIIDSDNQPWTKEQWEKSGRQKAQADTYTYRFRRADIGIGMDVQYESDKPGSFVRMQRFTPDIPLQIKDFKAMFPEIFPLVSSPQTVVFATYKELTRNLLEKNSPVTLGVAVRKELGATRKDYFTLLSFNVQDEGRLIKDPKYIDGNTYIREFTIERTYISILRDNLHGDWKEIKNFFAPDIKKDGDPTGKKKNKFK